MLNQGQEDGQEWADLSLGETGCSQATEHGISWMGQCVGFSLQETGHTGTEAIARDRLRTRSTDICSYISVLLAYLVGMQGLSVGFWERRCHLQAEHGVSSAPGSQGLPRNPAGRSSPSAPALGSPSASPSAMGWVSSTEPSSLPDAKRCLVTH